MDAEAGVVRADPLPLKQYYMNLLLLAYQSFGVVYGDLSTSPLYVFKSTFSGNLHRYQDEETVFGVLSLIFWTFTLIPLLKYVLIVLSADDNGEGGPFALYLLLCRHAKLSLLPNQQAADEELSSYYRNGFAGRNGSSPWLRRFMEKHKKVRTVLLLIVLCGASMVIGDGVLTPAISVLSSMSGLQVRATGLRDGKSRLSNIQLILTAASLGSSFSGQLEISQLMNKFRLCQTGPHIPIVLVANSPSHLVCFVNFFLLCSAVQAASLAATFFSFLLF